MDDMQNNVEQFNRYNYLAIEILEKIGNECPTESQIKIIEEILINNFEASEQVKFWRKFSEKIINS
jgi:hypothetical protein